jgi:predicted unusual protein kinase regulating ubiquinone biosynthesis (AarF/ABC1/UbiB family)
MPGIKVSQYDALDAAGVDRKAIARYGAQAYLHQLLNNGFFHADPHPGNLAVSPDGALIFYDFGMMGTIKSNVREGLMETLFGIAQKDGDRVVKSLVDLNAIVTVFDLEEKKDIKKNNFKFIKLDCSNTEDIENFFKLFFKKNSCPDVFINASYPATKDWKKNTVYDFFKRGV